MRRPTPDSLIWLLSTGLAAAGLLLWWSGLALPELGPQLWWPALAVVFALTERFAVHLPFGGENHSLTLNQAPLVLGMFLLPTPELVLAAVTGVVLVHVLRRNPLIKLAFNVGSTIAQVTVACFVFVAVIELTGGTAATGAAASWAAALLATLAADLVANTAVFVIISLRLGRRELGELGRTLVVAAIGTVVVTDLALVMVVVLSDNPRALALLGVVAVLSFALYRGYHVQRLRYSRLELLYKFTRSVDRALASESVMETVRAEACELLRARSASVVLCQPNVVAWWSAACEGKPVLLARGGESPEHDLLRAEGRADGLAAPLRDGGEITGVFLVSDRLDDMSTFDRDDLKLFEALAGHASVALTNSGLVARVRAAAQETEHLSLHDPLTGLPNRLHFQQRLEKRLLDRRVGGGAADGRRPLQGGQRHPRPRRG